MDTVLKERRRILVTGATGKQGGAVVRALLESTSSLNDWEILALTRNTSSKVAQQLALTPNVKLVAGNLDNAEEIFKQTGGVGSVWGVFSVQALDAKIDPYSDENVEYRQGRDLIDASIKNGVRHFVQTSVDRGGSNSDQTPTNIPHFITKHRIELYLKDKASSGSMTYTILRPVAFMDLITPNIAGRIMGAAIGQLGDKALQFVATRDIGIFAAQAFEAPDTDEYKNTAISLAGDELTLEGCNEAFWKALHRPMPVSYGFVGAFLLWMIPELGIMFQWFKDVGYGADINKCRKLNSKMLSLPEYLKQESAFKQWTSR